MNIEECIKKLIKRLEFHGYRRFQIKSIIDEAIQQSLWVKEDYSRKMQILLALEKYEKLSTEYLQAYSK